MDPFRFPAEPWLDVLIDQALREDVGSGDVSTAITVGPGARAVARLVAREAGVVAGLPLLAPLVQRLTEEVSIDLRAADGDRLAPGQVTAVLTGPAAPLLTVERTALNFLQQRSGIATLTARYVAAVAGTSCLVLDTRKTVPGWRSLAKYAVRCGGGANHRLGLYDCILLKDNHWATGGERIAELVARGRREHPHLAIEVEVDSLAQFDQVLPLAVEWILLDNFVPDTAALAVARRDRARSVTRLEASGNLTLETIGAYARAGVDACSVGRLTHSAGALDLALEMEPLP